MTAAQRKKIDDATLARNKANRARAAKTNARRKALNAKTSKGYKPPVKKVKKVAAKKTAAKKPVERNTIKNTKSKIAKRNAYLKKNT